MIIERTEHPSWLANAYLVADKPGGHGVLIDGNGVAGPLIERIERDKITITHILNTHCHFDHTADNLDFRSRFKAPIVAHPRTVRHLDHEVDQLIEHGEVIHSGDLTITAIHTPGHASGHLAFLVNDTDCFTADVLFKGSVGGTRAPDHTTFEDLRTSIMDKLMKLPPETRLHPGHRESTTVGEEWENNAFIRVWRGIDPEGDEPCKVGGDDATLILWAPDYDGGNKAWVRFANGEEAVIGGSQVERTSS